MPKKEKSRYKIVRFSQADDMRKIKVNDGEGKSRDERETCFPKCGKNDKRKGAGI